MYEFPQGRCASAKNLTELQRILLEAVIADWLKGEEATYLQAASIYKGAMAVFKSEDETSLSRLQPNWVTPAWLGTLCASPEYSSILLAPETLQAEEQVVAPETG